MTQNIAIIGATGNAGSALTHEAVERGYNVTVIVRNLEKAAELGSELKAVEVDALDLQKEHIEGFDAVINTVAFPPQDAANHLRLTENLISYARELGAQAPRLIFILGAGSLTKDGRRFVEEIRETPGNEVFIAIPENQAKQLDYLRTVDDVEWTGVSPQEEFTAGPATTPKLGKDEFLLASDGKSHTTTGTMAVAILNELENPQHRKTRFTVSDA